MVGSSKKGAVLLMMIRRLMILVWSKKDVSNVSSFKVWYGPMRLIAGQPPPSCIIIIEIAISTLATQDDSENLGSPAGLEDLETSTTAGSGSSDVSTALSSGSDDTKLGRVIAQLSQFKIKTEPKSTSGDHGSKSVPIPTAVDLTGSDDDEPHIVSTDVGPPSLPSRHERIVQILRDAKRRRLENNPPKKEERSTFMKNHAKGAQKPENPYVLPESAPIMS